MYTVPNREQEPYETTQHHIENSELTNKPHPLTTVLVIKCKIMCVPMLNYAMQ